MPGRKSKIALTLANVMRQLRTGKTRGKRPRVLKPEEIQVLEMRKDVLREKMNAARRERALVASKKSLESLASEAMALGQLEATSPPSQSPAPETRVTGQHLYIMQRSDAPDMVKIGRSNDPTKRADDLQSGHCFFVKVRATYPNAGSKERDVHHILHQHRVSEGTGTEWFRVPLSQAMSAVSCVLDS